MNIPTIELTQQEFDSLPTSQSTAWDQSRCKAKSSNGQWLLIDRDGETKAGLITIVKKKPAKSERRFGEWWIDLNLPERPEVAQSGKAMVAYLKDKYGIDGKTTKGARSMVMHMDGADWFSWQYEWEIGGKKFAQFTCHKRNPAWDY